MRELARVSLQQRFQRAHHHLRIACPRQAPARVAQERLLARRGLRAQLVLEQLHQRAQALERLARLVHRLGGRHRAVLRREQLDRQVELS